jgi:hypothetical protein
LLGNTIKGVEALTIGGYLPEKRDADGARFSILAKPNVTSRSIQNAAGCAGRKLRGVKPGVPDVLVWYRGRSITIELKSRQGVCSPA